MSTHRPIVISNGTVSATISPLGAELLSLRDREGRELLWQGDARFWASRSPILFPVVGRVPDDGICVHGRNYPMPLHGFARTSRFMLDHCDEASCTLSLRASKETRRHYPFEFRLALTYRVVGPALTVQAAIKNLDQQPLPFNFGFHPGLRWPLEPGVPKRGYFILLPKDDRLDVRRGANGFLGARNRSSGALGSSPYAR